MYISETPATLFQRKKIAQLAQALNINEPLEELPMTIGSAGQLIRELVARLKKRKEVVKL